MKRILLVEDDHLLNKTLTYNLTQEGYQIFAATNCRTAADFLQKQDFELALLDINLPDGDGYGLCLELKEKQPDAMIIFLTANDRECDQIKGYEAGAVDYITKPFSVAALSHKIKAMFVMLERHKPSADIYDDGRLCIDFARRTATLRETAVTFSSLEYKMLRFFCQNAGQVLTRGQLLEKLWDAEERYVDEHTLTTTVSRIRSKIEAAGDHYIKTVYGMGYQWVGEHAARNASKTE